MPNINDYGLPFTSEDGDRKYSALEWREYFSRLIHNGLIQNAANECQVKPQAVPDKTVYVDTGVVFINGAMRVLEEPITLTVAENTSGNPRIDRVVARLNEADRTIEFDVLEGTPAGSPVAPALTRTEGVYELGLADITLTNGYSTITAAEIADQRWDVSLCGASSMTIGVIPPSGLEAETVTLSAETAGLYGIGNVDEALKELKNSNKDTPLSSYMALISNVNAAMNSSAFVPSRIDELEDSKIGLGFQIAKLLSDKNHDSTLTAEEFMLLSNQNTWWDICRNCKNIISRFTSLISIVSASEFAKYVYEADGGYTTQQWVDSVNLKYDTDFNSVSEIKQDTATMNLLMNDPLVTAYVFSDDALEAELFGETGENLTLLKGSGNFVVPAGVTNLNYTLVTNGLGSGNSVGKLKAGAIAVTPGQSIAYSVGATTTFGSESTASAQIISNTNTGIFKRANPGEAPAYTEFPGGTGGGAGFGAAGGQQGTRYANGIAGAGGVGPGNGGGGGGTGGGTGGPGGKGSISVGNGYGPQAAGGAKTSSTGGAGGNGVTMSILTKTDSIFNLVEYYRNFSTKPSILYTKAKSLNVLGGAGGGSGQGTPGAGGNGEGGATGSSSGHGSPASGCVCLFW